MRETLTPVNAGSERLIDDGFFKLSNFLEELFREMKNNDFLDARIIFVRGC
jgi:hypothetical protein